MEDTIKIRSIDKKNWNTTLQSFQPHTIEPNTIEQVWVVYNANGLEIGIICGTVEGKYYINAQAEFNYSSLGTAAGVLLKRQK